MHLLKKTLFCILSFSLSQMAAQVSPPIASSPETPAGVVLRGNIHPLARAEFDRGAAPDDLPQQRMLLLLRRSDAQESALEQLLQEQQTKFSPNYHEWVSPEEFGLRFGPSNSQVQSVTSWLKNNGFQVNRISKGGNVIEFSGTAGQVRTAFRTQIHKYSIRGQEHWANSSDPQIPAAITSLVRGVVSLNNFSHPPMTRPLGIVQRSALTGELQPSFTFAPSGTNLYGVGPSDFATIYSVQPLWNSAIDGTGQTIAIVAESNINVSDVQSFRSLFGLPPNPPQIILNGPDPGLIPGPETEAVADVEWSGAVAKNATIDLVVSSSTETTAGIDLSALYILENNLAPVLSMSFGDCEATIGTAENAFYNELWKQAAAQGITVVISTGDNLSAGCDDPNGFISQKGLAVSGVASTPYNIAVGGTDFDQRSNPGVYWNTANNPSTAESAKSYIPEMTWNLSCAQYGLTGCENNGTNSGNAGGSGGQSSLYSKPSWQSGPGVPADGKRDIPDVSLFASEGNNLSFYLICEADRDPSNAGCSLSSTAPNLLGVGGTSISAQAFGGVMALVNQSESNHGRSGKQGNANYVLYPLAAQTNNSCNSTTTTTGTSSCIFYDITKGNISAECTLNITPNCGGPGATTGVLVDPANPTTPAWTTTAGFDLATGLGSVNVANLVNNWAGVTFTPTATNLSVSPTTLTHGQSATVNIAVSPNSGSGTPTGDISLVADATGGNRSLGIFTLSNGTVNGQSTSSLSGGSYNVIAHYAGDGTYAASSSNSVPVVIKPEASKTLVSLVTFDPNSGAVVNGNATSAVYGSPYVLRMDVGNSSVTSAQLCAQANLFTCPSGSLNLTDGGVPLDGGSFKLNSEGFTEDLQIQLTGGTHSLQAQYSGDNSYLASSGSNSITITRAPSSVYGFPSSCCVLVGASITLPVTVNAQSNGAAPTGTITLLDIGNVPIASATLSPLKSNTTTRSSQATFTLSFSTPGQHNLQEQYSGDQNYAPSSGFSGGPDVQFTPTVTISANPQTVQYPGNVTLTAIVHSGQKSPTPSDSIQFYGAFGNGVPTYTNITDPDGTAALQITETYSPPTSEDVSAYFFGDPNYVQAASPAIHITVNGGPDFSLAASQTNLSLNKGQSASATITESELNGFSGPINFSCAIQNNVAGLGCSVAPDPVTAAGGSTSASTTLTITAPQTASIRHDGLFASLGFIAAGVLIAVPRGNRKRNASMMALLFVALTFGGINCGGGGNTGASATGGSGGVTIAQPQTYTVTVTGSGSVLNQVVVSHTVNVSVTVQ